MNSFGKKMGRLALVALILSVALLVGCTPDERIFIYHATGVQAAPYEKLEVTRADLALHVGHPNDLLTMPAGGCPAYPVEVNNGKITICHATGSTTNPYNEITVSVNGLNGHGGHEGDIISMAAGGCPADPPKDKK